MNEQEMLLGLIEWYTTSSKKCHLIIDCRDADMRFPGIGGDDEGLVIPAGSVLARGIQIGASLALDCFTPFPLTIASADDGDCEDE